jgi:hypothetical protein
MSEIKTLVISAFPGTGKSYCYTNEKHLFNGILDSDSSEFKWLKDNQGNKTNQVNPEFPNNYIQHIKDNIGKVEIIFVSSHKEIREALKLAGIEYILVYPNTYQKKEYLKRYKERGSNKAFIDRVESNWEDWIDQCRSEDYPINICLPYFSCKYLNKEVIELITLMNF